MIIDKVWRIAVGDTYQEYTKTWIDQGFDVETVEATVPDTMPNNLKFGLKKKRIYGQKTSEFSDTEKAVCYSHYLLWKRCIEQNYPAIIIEHDTELILPFPREWDVERLKYFCIGYNARFAPHTKYTPAAGYVLSVEGAKWLTNRFEKRKISFNVDHYLRLVRDTNPKEWAVKYAHQPEGNKSTIEHRVIL